MNYEKIFTRTLVLFNAVLYSFIGFLAFFILGLVNVDAQSLTWNTPTYNSINRGYPGQNLEQQKDYSMTVGQPGLLGNLGNYSWAIYDVSKNNINSSYTTLEKGTYSIAFTAIYELWYGYTPTYKLLVFDNGTQYTATCDYGEKIEIEPYYFASFGGTAYKFNYTCEKLNMNLDNVTHISIGVNTGNTYTINYAQVVNNLYLYDLKDGSTDFGGVIASNNKNTQDLINSQRENTEKIENSIKESNETNKSILGKITDFFENFFDGLIGLIVPDNFDFLTGFIDVLENKLGFIASVPIQILEFMIDLVTYNIDEFTSITLPKFSVLGYDLWQDLTIDLTSIIDTFKPYRIYTNIACVSLASYYMMKLYENFASGGGD